MAVKSPVSLRVKSAIAHINKSSPILSSQPIFFILTIRKHEKSNE